MSEDNKLSQAKKIELFESEFLPHIKALKTFAYYLTYDENEANDLVQETYLKAFKYVEKYKAGTNSKAWLFRILKNGYINNYRKKKKEPDRVDFDDIVSYHKRDDVTNSKYLDLKEDGNFEEVMGDEITRAINSLPDEFRQIILLADIEDFSYKEISDIIEVPIGTVRSRLFRARNLLKELLRKYALSLGYKDYRGNKRKRIEEE